MSYAKGVVAKGDEWEEWIDDNGPASWPAWRNGGPWATEKSVDSKIKNLSGNTYATFRKEIATAVSTVKKELLAYFASPDFTAENSHQEGLGQAAHELQALRGELAEAKEHFAYLHASVAELAEELHRVKTNQTPAAPPRNPEAAEVKCITAIRRTVKDNLDVQARIEVGKVLEQDSAQYLLYFKHLVDSGFISFDAGSVKIRMPQTASAAREEK
ncbi:hypothetical protein CYMTET_12600 [Cymbomonas tetramitiformis]|uniref:Uncharacterized protein n=1 Tax=Cymbomonas tetramitiformis TaxID=36881 RepID=A0AAE0GK49_9CHLO|nr:hypothetical protein CYMTET_12600 [Cymbomonas tetramitiformis]